MSPPRAGALRHPGGKHDRGTALLRLRDRRDSTHQCLLVDEEAVHGQEERIVVRLLEGGQSYLKLLVHPLDVVEHLAHGRREAPRDVATVNGGKNVLDH